MNTNETPTQNIAQSEVKPSNLSKGKENLPLNMPTLEEVKKAYFMQVLTAVEGNKDQAAVVLGVSKKSVYNMLAKYTQTNG